MIELKDVVFLTRFNPPIQVKSDETLTVESTFTGMIL